MRFEKGKRFFNRSSVKFFIFYTIIFIITSPRDWILKNLGIEKNYTSLLIFYSVLLAVLGLGGLGIGYLEMRKKYFKKINEELLIILLSLSMFIYSIYFALKGMKIIS